MRIFYIFILLAFCFISNAQISPTQAISEMGRGINLGNTLEPPLEGGWNNGPAQESYFDAYVDAGFKNVRVPVRWDEHTGNSAPFKIDETWLNRVEEVIDWGLDRGLYITLNGHHEDWLKNAYNNATFRARYDSIWVQVADRFKDKSEKLLFEIINEPNGMSMSQVNDLNARILSIIRKTNPTRLVLYSGNMYSNAEQLIGAAIPEDDYLIGYYHSYDPWSFSGQSQGTWGTAADYQALNSRFQSVKNWSETNNIPVHYNEFGAMVNCDFNSRMRIYAHYTERAVESGFAFAVWDDGGDFRILNRGPNTWPETKNILVHYYIDSPAKVITKVETNPATQTNFIRLTWENRTDSTKPIAIERATNSNTYVSVGTLAASSTEYIDTDVIEGNTYTYRMFTYREDGTLLHGYPSRIVLNSTVQGAYQGQIQEIPGEIEPEFYDLGGENVAYHDNDAANQASDFRPGEGVDIGGNGTGGYMLGYVEKDEWIEYTVDVKQEGLYDVKAMVASQIANGRFSITFSGNGASTTFDTPSTGSWVNMQEISANTPIELNEGIQILRIDIIGTNAFNLDKLQFDFLTPTKNMVISEESVLVFPNPVSDLIQIDYDEHILGAVSIKLIDIQGRILIDKSSTTKSNIFDIKHLTTGNYTLIVANENGSISRVISKL